MPSFRPWKPSLRCDRCKAICPVDALMAWLSQPPAGDGGRVHFVCRRCQRVGGGRGKA